MLQHEVAVFDSALLPVAFDEFHVVKSVFGLAMAGFDAVRIGLMRHDHRVRDVEKGNLGSVVIHLADQIVVVARPADHHVFDERPVERVASKHEVILRVRLEQTALLAAVGDFRVVLSALSARKLRKRSEDVGSATYQENLRVMQSAVSYAMIQQALLDLARNEIEGRKKRRVNKKISVAVAIVIEGVVGFDVHHHVPEDRRAVPIALHFANKIDVVVEFGKVLIGGRKHDDSHAWTQSDQTAQCVSLDLVLLWGLQIRFVWNGIHLFL